MLMAPRKRSSSSSSSKKSNQNNHSQPAKFGIQHFFERHSQAVASTPSPSDRNAADAPKQLPHSPANSKENTPPLDASQNISPKATVDSEGSPSEISPEALKSASLKRYKFSPRTLIKPTQDDGVDDVSWKVSPLNNKFRATAQKLPENMNVLSDASKLNVSSIRICSQKQTSPSSPGKIEKMLSPSTVKATEKSLISSERVYFEEVGTMKDKELHVHQGGGDPTIACSLDSQKHFETPPSTSYCLDKSLPRSLSKAFLHETVVPQHRKALIELLDQVEDAVIVEEPVVANSREHLPRNPDEMCSKFSTDANSDAEKVKHGPLAVKDYGPYNLTFLVLEVSENFRVDDSSSLRSPYKVLRLLNEQYGVERVLLLYDEWFYSLIEPGDTINVIGDFDDLGHCVVDRDRNLVVVHPNILIAGTRVSASFTCPRRSVLDERIKFSDHSAAALIGSLLHQIFQACLLQDSPTRNFLEDYAGIVLQKNIESLYACGVNENDTYATLIHAIPKILSWVNSFRGLQGLKSGSVDFGSDHGRKEAFITEVVDIEEMAWAPRYGLKGMIDASVQVKLVPNLDECNGKIMPLEFKTGKGSSGRPSMEHCAQVILYTMLMSERYAKEVDSGLLYCLQADHTQGITVRRSDVVGLIMRRNELAADILKASTLQQLPTMLRNPNTCKNCHHLDSCTIYHKAHGGNAESSGLGSLFDSRVNHLTTEHSEFLRKWDRLIDLEAQVTQAAKSQIWRSSGLWDENSSGCLSNVVLDVSNDALPKKPSKDGRYTYHFMHKESRHYLEMNGVLDNTLPPVSNWCQSLKCGDYVIISTDSGRVFVANGAISAITNLRVSVSFSRPLRLPGEGPSEVADIKEKVWQINKDEATSSFGIMRFNLVQLFARGATSHLRKMIVDLEMPRFDSGGIFSQDPAISYIRSEKNINDDQRRAVHKILTAKDYALILGMPGTGKTSTMVYAVKALLMRGASVLLTSYTNSAVDNILIKLKAQAIDFVRIGREDTVHYDVRSNCFSAANASVEDVRNMVDEVKVVGVTCLGINHPFLAMKKFDICIMDEAGQITLPMCLGPLMLSSTFVLVGDHYQLPPLVQSTEAKENGMGVSLFCRLSEAHPYAISALQCQYRMCSDIMELSNSLIYGNRLRCGSSEIANAMLEFSSVRTSASWLEEVLEPSRSVIFINTDMLSAAEKRENKNVSNPIEAYIVAELTVELNIRGIIGDAIGIITPYNSQATLLRHALGTNSVEIHTIDKYQGRDKDCILLSFVRSCKNPKTCSSTILGDWHRINVAITRAKKKLIMVGSRKTLNRVPLLKFLIEKVEEKSGILNVSKKDILTTRVQLKKCSQMAVS